MTEKPKETTDVVGATKPSPQKVNLSTVTGFSSVLKNYEKSIAQLLQTKYGISPQEFYVSAINAIKKNPKLLNCDPKSLFGAILLSAEVGLRFNTPEQHAFILPYGKEAKFQIGYKGLVEMMYRNPRVLSISAEAVFEKDEFDYGYGLTPFLIHKPFRKGDRGKLECVYAVCKLKDADAVFTVVEKSELDKTREFSQNKDSKHSPYNNGTDIHHFMEIKTAIKKLSKLIPKASVLEISKAVEYDSRFESGATVKAEIPNSPDDIIQAEVSDSSKKSSLSNAFDFSEADDVTFELNDNVDEFDLKTVAEVTKEEEVSIPKATPVKHTKKAEKKPESKVESDGEVDFSTIGNVKIEPIDNSGLFGSDESDDIKEPSLF
jgi:recombination protein RecT